MPGDENRPGINEKRPVLSLLASHWVSLLGAGLVTTAGFSWLFVLPMHLRDGANNPYIGLLAFIGIPIVFFAGLALIPLGIYLAKRRIAAGLAVVANRRVIIQRLVLFFGVMTAINIVIGSQVTYRAVSHMETTQFCGQSCHVMKPQFTAHFTSPHREVTCVECHVTPGATGFIKAKIAGTRQLVMVLFNSFPRPIPPGLVTGRLAQSAETCEECHSRATNHGAKLVILSKFMDNEANTPTRTVLLMRVGGGRFGGIHGAHFGPGVEIRYAAADADRQTIPLVEYHNSESGVIRTYVAGGTKPASVAAMPSFTMQCADCHNRPGHSFDLPEQAVDRALAKGDIPATLPYAKKNAVQILKATYATDHEAAAKIPAAFTALYQNANSNDVTRAARAVLALYQSNVFPDLKVTWGSYPNNLGHADYPGCFRCHDENHATAAKKTISQDCNLCHNPLAVDETSPDILKTLGLAAR